jgi:hypothetical protein
MVLFMKTFLSLFGSEGDASGAALDVRGLRAYPKKLCKTVPNE